MPRFGRRSGQYCRRRCASIGFYSAMKRHADTSRDGARRFISTIAAHRDYFDSGADIFVARAPGRLDLMGGIADYSGSLVLELPLAVATWVAAQPVDEPIIRIHSDGAA